jgi:isoamylase
MDGHRFNPNKVVIDPYADALTDMGRLDLGKARAFDTRSSLQDLSFSSEDNVAAAPRCIVVDHAFDWAGDQPLGRTR